MLMSDIFPESSIIQSTLAREERIRDKMDQDLTNRCYDILEILRDAPNHPEVKYNATFFETRLKTSKISVYRAIRKLKDMDLLEEKQKYGSYVIKKDIGQVYSKDTKKNLALIASLSGVLQQYKNTPLFENISKLIHFLEPKVVKDNSLFSTGRVIAAPQLEYDINVRNWDKVYEGIQINHKIKFRYTKPYSDNNAQRIVWPYQLILDNGSVYLFAYSENADDLRIYDVNFMADVVILNEKFDLPEDYDLNKFSGGGRLGTFKGEKNEKYKIRFTEYAKLWMKSHKLADDQTFKEDDESTTITFSSSQFERVLEFILGWGHQAEPLAPARLVKRWKEEILAMAELVKEKK